MDITLTKRAIQIKLRSDSINLKPLMYFIENSFTNVKYYSNITVVSGDIKESIKIRYLLRWAYKIYYKNPNHLNAINFKKLSDSIHLPIHILSMDHKHISNILTMTIEHICSNELSVTSNQYNSQVIRYFKNIFKDSMMRSVHRRTFKLSIHTKNDLLHLQQILSSKIISNTRVSFITHGLNFNRLAKEGTNKEELEYEEKLKKSYKVLSINDNSTSKEIKNNYKKMLKKYHPDRVYSEDNDLVQLYTKRFQVIQEAYELVQEHHSVA